MRTLRDYPEEYGSMNESIFRRGYVSTYRTTFRCTVSSLTRLAPDRRAVQIEDRRQTFVRLFGASTTIPGSPARSLLAEPDGRISM